MPSPDQFFLLLPEARSDLVITHIRIAESGIPFTRHLVAISAMGEFLLFYAAGIDWTGIDVSKFSPEDTSSGA